MTIPEFNKKLGDSVTKIDNSLGEIMVELGSDALATITKRVQEQGTDAEGNKFAPYSTRDMYVGAKQMNTDVARSFFGKQNNKKHKWVTLERTYNEGPKAGKKIRLAVLPGGYKKFRELHGHRTDITNFSFKNDMWNDMGIISNASEHNSGYVTIGPREELQMKKLKGNVDRRGQILDLSDAEIRELNDRFGKKIINIIG
jgi:hypothetical protein